MDDVTDRDLIIAAFRLGVNFGRQAEVSKFMKEHGIPFTTEMAKELMNHEFMFSGYEHFQPIIELKVPPEVHAKLMAAKPPILIVAELMMVTIDDLIEIYELTPEEANLVNHEFAFGTWQLMRSVQPQSD